MRQKSPDGDTVHRAAALLDLTKLGDVSLQRVVQSQQSLIPQLQDGGRGKRLGNRGNPGDRIFVRTVRTVQVY